MKRLYNILFVFGFMAAASCSQHDVTEGVKRTIQATFPEVLESKVSLTEKGADTGLALSWEKSDKLVIVGETVETYTLTEIDGKKATFAGKEVNGNVFDVILSSSDDYESRSYLSQTQTGVHATEHLEYDACLKGVDTYSDVEFTQEWAAEHGGELLQSGCLLLYFQLPISASEVTQVKVEASAPVFYATNSESSLKSSSLVMDVENGVVGIEKTVKAYLMTSMQEAVIESGTALRVIVETDLGTYYKDIVPGQVGIKPGRRNVIKLNSKNWKPIKEYKNFTFMTYNVGKFIKSEELLGRHSYQEVVSIIKYCRADIVGLNEITTYQVENNKILDLTNQIGVGWSYYAAIPDGVNSGNAIIASPEHNVVRRTQTDLPCLINSSPNEPDKIYQTRSLGVVESDDYVFCVTHLDHNLPDNRKDQIEKINNWIKSNYGSSEKPIILVGDMNATPTSSEIKNNFASCWQAIADTDMMTYPTSGATKCIDYIFLWKNDAVDYKVNETKVLYSCPSVDMSLASDHYPVYADIAFAKKYAVEELKGQVQGGVDRLPDTLVYEERF